MLTRKAVEELLDHWKLKPHLLELADYWLEMHPVCGDCGGSGSEVVGPSCMSTEALQAGASLTPEEIARIHEHPALIHLIASDRIIATLAERDRRMAELEKERDEAPHSPGCPSVFYDMSDIPCGPPCWKAVKP